ncbi:MAG: DEAD/DEAH box helicase [Treponema sp.]
MNSFKELNLSDDVLKAIEKKGFEKPTPIQELTIPRLLLEDINIVAKARTGTGKTAAFALPLIQKITKKQGFVEALILVPTRELALQVGKEIDSFILGDFPRTVTLYGGAPMGSQLRELKNGVEIVVGTPGRVFDHLERGSLDISKIKYFILDEADEMLNMGFVEDIENIFGFANKQAQILMFSATMPKPILKIASDFMSDYEIIEEQAQEDAPVLQEQFFWMVSEKDKIEALARLIDVSEDFYALIFCQTKIDTDEVAKALEEKHYQVAALHGDIPQSIREKILLRFRNKHIKILVATDVAARGIDVEGLTHVVNYALPFDSAIYTHRIGRTGRAGKSGIAVSFVRPNEIKKMEYIKRATNYNIKEEKIPSIKEVLENKRTRLLFSIVEKLQKSIQDAPDQSFIAFTKKLLEYGSAEDILSYILQLQYNSYLSPSQYKNIKPLYSEKPKKDRAKKQLQDMTKIFIAWGRKDGCTKKRIADMLSNLLSIPSHFIDDIEVQNKFSLASLPNKAALMATRLSKKNKDVPHIHLDERKDEKRFTGKRKTERKHRKF